MASDKRKVYFSSLTIRKLCDYEVIRDSGVIKNIFDQIVSAYSEAIATKNVQNFQIDMGNGEFLILTDLHYVANNHFCGRVGRCSTRMNIFLRESNPNTFLSKELIPSEGNLFENYSFFALSMSKLQIGYLNNDRVSQNIPKLIIEILKRNLGSEPYVIELCTLLDHDIKARIKNLQGNIIVKGVMDKQEQQVVGGMPSLKRLEQALGSKFSATVKLNTRVTKIMTDAEIDEITLVTSEEDGFSSFTFAEEQAEEKEVVDVIKRQAYLSKTITLNADEQKNQDIIWQRMCSVF